MKAEGPFDRFMDRIMDNVEYGEGLRKVAATTFLVAFFVVGVIVSLLVLVAMGWLLAGTVAVFGWGVLIVPTVLAVAWAGWYGSRK